MRNKPTKPKPSLMSVRLSQPEVDFLQDLEEFLQQMEAEGCPAATANELRELTRIAAARTLVESAQRNLFHLEIKRSVDKLRARWMSSDLEGSSEALDEIRGFASQLPYSAEQQIVLRRVKQMRKCLPEECGR